MLRLSAEVKIFVANQAVDFRKSINGLTIVVTEHFTTPVNDGSVYVFYNRDCNRVKCLFWDKNGFVLYHKRLEQGRFKLKRLDGSVTITPQQLDWLLAGLEFRLMAEFSELNFTNYF